MNLTPIPSISMGSSLTDKHPAFEAGDEGSNPSEPAALSRRILDSAETCTKKKECRKKKRPLFLARQAVLGRFQCGQGSLSFRQGINTRK